MPDSIFTKIIKGELPCHKIYEDGKVIAFLTIDPITKGHTLVVPKQQVDLIWDLNEDSYKHLMAKSKEIAQHLQKVIRPKRVGMIVEGFGVPHTHVHLIPLNESIDKTIKKHNTQEPDHEALAKIAKELSLS